MLSPWTRGFVGFCTELASILANLRVWEILFQHERRCCSVFFLRKTFAKHKKQGSFSWKFSANVKIKLKNIVCRFVGVAYRLKNEKTLNGISFSGKCCFIVLSGSAAFGVYCARLHYLVLCIILIKLPPYASWVNNNVLNIIKQILIFIILN